MKEAYKHHGPADIRLTLCPAGVGKISGPDGAKRLPLGCAHPSRMPLIVKKDVPLYPMQVCFFGTNRIVLDPDPLTQLIQKTRRP